MTMTVFSKSITHNPWGMCGSWQLSCHPWPCSACYGPSAVRYILKVVMVMAMAIEIHSDGDVIGDGNVNGDGDGGDGGTVMGADD